MIEYTRSDLAQSQIKAAEAAALRKAAEVAFHAALSELKHCASCDGDLAAIDVEIGASNVGCEVIDLISDDQQSALDAALLAAKEEGFWIGRSTGGSRAEIDAALAEIRGDTQ